MMMAAVAVLVNWLSESDCTDVGKVKKQNAIVQSNDPSTRQRKRKY